VPDGRPGSTVHVVSGASGFLRRRVRALHPAGARRVPVSWSWAGLLVLALLHAQGLGLWHRVAHAGWDAPAQASAIAEVAAADVSFGHGSQDHASCRLYDHLGAADALMVLAPLVLPALLPVRFDGAVATGTFRPCQLHYEARAPPLG
jgi:hypothetical protein